MAERRFASVCSAEPNKKNTAQKTERDVRLLGRFLKTKVEDRKVEAISAVELNGYISQFNLSSPSGLTSKFISNCELRTKLEEK